MEERLSEDGRGPKKGGAETCTVYGQVFKDETDCGVSGGGLTSKDVLFFLT